MTDAAASPEVASSELANSEVASSAVLGLDFGAVVRERYERWLPERLAGIPEDERHSFFSTLAEEIAERAQTLELALRGPGREDETFVQRLGRFNMARSQATEMALAELLPAPDQEGPDDDCWIPKDWLMVTDRDIAAAHDLGPEDPDYEPMMEAWRQRHRENGTYGPTPPA
jgi:hypothetical protein